MLSTLLGKYFCLTNVGFKFEIHLIHLSVNFMCVHTMICQIHGNIHRSLYSHNLIPFSIKTKGLCIDLYDTGEARQADAHLR